MSNVAITIENLSKQYRLGLVGTGTLAHDLKRWWAVSVMRGEDPYLKIGEANVQKDRGTSQYVWALRDINLEVRQGEVLGIIGRNGAGKSTLLKILSRVTRPTTGTVSYRGRIASLLEVGTGFHPEMTGRENIFMNGSIMGMTKAEIRRKFDEIVDFAGVERYIDTPVKRYSSGMTVRLGFAVAAHLEPEILVVDEVLAVGDAEFQKKAVGKMQDVSRQEGRTVLFVSHNMAAVSNLCKRGLVLQNGKLHFDGGVEEAISFYLSSNENSNGSSGLSERLDRKGSGLLKITEVNFKDSETGSILPILRSGQNINIEINYKTELKLGEDIAFGISVFNKEGSHLFSCRSDIVESRITVGEELKSYCIIEDFPLAPGNYKYNLVAYHKNIPADHIIDAGIIEVESGDFFRTGKLPASGRAGVLIKFKWL